MLHLSQDAEPGPALAGMLIAANLGTQWGYVTPIQTVLRDIKVKTNCSVSLPVGRPLL